MSQAHIHSDIFLLIFTNLSLDFRLQKPSKMGADDKFKIMSMAFSMWAAMIQSTINSQCGQLQPARSHAIRSKFQAWFSPAFRVVSPSLQCQGVMSVQCDYQAVRWRRSTRVCVCVCVSSLHSWRGDLLFCFRFDCKWSNLTLKLNSSSYPGVSSNR